MSDRSAITNLGRIYEGGYVFFRISTQNIGDDYSGQLIGYTIIQTPPPGVSPGIGISFSPINQTPISWPMGEIHDEYFNQQVKGAGTYTITYTINSPITSGETNTANNSHTFTFEVIPYPSMATAAN
jgi:hypothetical protein